ncbi:MAG: hypothetical protein FGM58_08520 [Acidimicrobiia bacterium]|nr:hypothetical protein [Acidimicrobiia bacterium]
MRISALRRSTLAVVVTFALVAGACSDSSSPTRAAGAASGDPTGLSALPAGSGTGERVPAWFRAELTPSSWVSTSTTPTLVVPGASGAWTFKVSDLSGGTSPFGVRTYVESGASTRIPAGLLENGTTYTWTAESPGQASVGGSFTVDVQMLDAQQVDSLGGVDVLLSSGEAAYSWTSHTMGSLGGAVGVALRFQASNAPSPGVPAGWRLATSSSSPYVSVISRADGSVGLVSQNGQVSSYRKGGGISWNPVRMAGDGLDTTGIAPVLIGNADGSWSVTSKASTARFVDDNGDGTANLTDISADGAPMLQQQWAGGLLRKIIDPVSGRSVELEYGGGSCPSLAPGFVAAPAGMLCQVRFWDGSTSSFSYVTLPDGSVSIGRLTDFGEAGADGAQVADVAYDASGRIARTRAPLVAVTAASTIVGVDDRQFWSEVAYRPDGRVASVTGPAPSVGGPRCTRTHDNEGTMSVVSDSCLGRVVTTVTFDGSTFFPLSVADVTGRTSRYLWNLATGDLLSWFDATERLSVNVFADGNLVQTRGPSRDLGTAQVVVREYDESYARAPEGEAMRGLDVVYWPSATERGADAVQELGPTLDGSLTNSLTVNWDASPAQNRTGGWSGAMSGSLSVTTPGTYAFASGNTTARLRVANIACEDGGCGAIDLPAGPVSIRVEIESATPKASMDLTWSGPDTGGVSQSIPTDRLRPSYGFATETRIVDETAIRANRENISRTTYSDPSRGLVTGRTNGAGSVSSIVYESSGWNRPTGSVLPAGNRVTQTWWGDRESATAPCPGAKGANQGGAMKQTVTPGPDGGAGPSAQQWYTASGAVAATRLAGGATSCLTYDRAGRVVRAENLGLGETSVIEIVHAVDGNPLVTSTIETQGDERFTTTIEVDLAGRVVRSVDRNGIVTVSTYDPRTGALATESSTPPGGAPAVTSYTYDEFGRLVTTSLDGRAMATLGHGEFGLVRTITYGNGAVTSVTPDAQDRAIAATTVVAGRTYASSRVLSAAGVTSSATLVAEGRSSTFDYTHDANGRLSAVAVSAGLVPEVRTWAYTYDANSNRTSQTVTVGGTTDRFTYDHDGADRLVSTTDPAAANITYDERGNALTLGPDTLTYDAANLLTSATDGTTTVTWRRAADGSVIGKTTTDASGTTTVRYGAGGFVLDEQGRATVQILSLPGGVKVTRPAGTTNGARWTFTTLGGDRFVTVDDAGAQIGQVAVFTPFGEQVLGATTVDATVPDLEWKATEGNETIALRTPVVAMGQRVYVPALGRFVQVDPVVGGSANGYDYANQDPTSSTDPSGMADSSWTDWVGMALVAVAAVAASLAVPVGRGPYVAMAVGAAVGLVAGAVNLVVQMSIGGDTTIAVASAVVGVLAGVAAGGISNKVKMSRLVKQQAAAERAKATAASRAISAAEEGAAADRARFLARNPDLAAKAEYTSLDDFLAKEGSMFPGEAKYGRDSLKRATVQSVKQESVRVVSAARQSADDNFANFMAFQQQIKGFK